MSNEKGKFIEMENNFQQLSKPFGNTDRKTKQTEICEVILPAILKSTLDSEHSIAEIRVNHSESCI